MRGEGRKVLEWPSGREKDRPGQAKAKFFLAELIERKKKRKRLFYFRW